MGLFDYGSIGSWFINPVGNLIELLNKKAFEHKNDYGTNTPGYNEGESFRGDIDRTVSKVYDDLTGVSSIKLQNKLNREMAEEEYQRNLQSIGDTAAAYDAAGFNRNLLYSSGSSPVSYNAPNLQAYSGSSKLDTIMNRVGKVLQFIPAMYQATAALESIDQARERTKQSEIKTMSMGMNLLDQGYKLGHTQASFNWFPSIEKDNFGDKRHFKDIHGFNGAFLPIFQDDNSYSRYQDAAIKHQMDLLAAIGIKNQMNSTLNNWRGYQYSLDRRFGAAGRIVGLASQGTRAAASLFQPIKLFGK